MKKIISFILCMAICIGIMPVQIFAHVDHPIADYDGLILEFDCYETMALFMNERGGDYLGGNMLLIDGAYKDAVDYDMRPDIVSVTFNYIVEATAILDTYSESRNTALDDPYLNSENLDFWRALATIADTLPEDSLHTVRVAVLDTGIDTTHQDLADRVVAGYDAIEDEIIAEGINSEQNTDSHGTKVAGLIGAQAMNATGISGTGGDFPIELVPVRVLDQKGKGKIADIVRGIYWAIENDIDIMNMSFGARMEYYPTALANAIYDATNQNIFAVAAAGNEYGRTWEGYYPACLEGCYPVMSGIVGMGADYTSAFSNTFPTGAIPGKDYTSINGSEVMTTAMNDQYTSFTGTSASCAMISGYSAAIFSLLGGRKNPDAAQVVRDIFAYAHVTNTNLIPYSIVLSELDHAVQAYVTSEEINKASITIQGSIECEDWLVGDAEINVNISAGEENIGDVIVVIRDAEENIVYTSSPIANDGTNPFVYRVTVDTTLFDDGEVTIEAYFRTVEESAAEADLALLVNKTKKSAIIKNNLVSEEAIIKLYDESGAIFSATVYVTDPQTGTLVDIIGNNSGDLITIPRTMFAGGALTFTCISNGIYYTKTAEFADEISLGGDEAQLTHLSFAGNDLILAGADIFAKAPNGQYCSLGKTDENGTLDVHFSDGRFPLIVIDNEKNYVLSVEAVQDGNQIAISFADSIAEANEINLDFTEFLADDDRYSLIFSFDELTNAVNGVSTTLFNKSVDRIFVSADSIYTMVAVYDVIHLSNAPGNSAYYKYFYTGHILGEMNFDEINAIVFDPTAIYTSSVLQTNRVIYGQSVVYSVTITDDKGNSMIGGHYLDYSTLGEPIDCYEWYGSCDLRLFDSSENDHSWMIGISQNTIYTTTDYGMALPAGNADYKFTAKCYIDIEGLVNYEGYDGALQYGAQESFSSFSVEMGPTLTIDTSAIKDGNLEFDTRYIKVIQNGVVKKAKLLSQGSPIMIDTTGFDENTKIFLWATMYYFEETPLGVWNYCFPVVIPYNPENTTVSVEIPQVDFGLFDVQLDGYSMSDMLMILNVDGVNVSVSSGYEAGYPVGTYELYFKGQNQNNQFVLDHRTVTVSAGTKNVVEVNTADYTQITVNKSDMTEVFVYPIVNNKKIEWNESYYGMLYDLTNEILISPLIDGILVKFNSMNYEFEGGVAYEIEVPFSANSISLDAMGTSIYDFNISEEKVEFTTDENVQFDFSVIVTGGLKLHSMSQSMMKDGKNPIQTYLFASYSYRMIGGEWINGTLDNWNQIDLGMLEAGTYELQLEFEEPGTGILLSDRIDFVILGESEPENTIVLTAPEAASGKAEITITGVYGATVSLTYKAPNGTSKTLDAIVLPITGIYRVNIPLTEEGEYSFNATSSLNGADQIQSETIYVENSFAIPSAITGVSVIALPDGSLKLTWDAPVDAEKVYIHRDGKALGYLPADTNSYTDDGALLNLSRTYTYSLIAENLAGTKSEPVYVQGKPSAVVDTEAPTAPVTVTATSNGTSIVLDWTRSTDNVGVIGYRIYRNGILIKDSVKRSFTDEGLDIDTEYVYTITAYDGAGNESAQTAIAVARTATTYSIDSFKAEIDTNRQGAMTDNRMSFIVGVSSVDSVTIIVSYITKDGESLIREINLGKSGAYWTGEWTFDRVKQIVSVNAYAYKGEEIVAQQSASGFPRSVSSSIGFTMTVSNAQYAQHMLENAQIVLKDTNRDLIFRQSIASEAGAQYYSFERLSAGNYDLSVEYTEGGTHYTLYSEKNISLSDGIEKVLSPIEISNFVRIKQDYPYLMYGVTIYDGLGDDKYLLCGEDSAVFVSGETDTLTLITPWKNIPIYMNGAFYTLADYYHIDIENGVTEYEVDAFLNASVTEAKTYTFDFIATNGADLSGMEVTFSWDQATLLAKTDENGRCRITVPASLSQMKYEVKETALTNDQVVLSSYNTVELEEGTVSYSFPINVVHRPTLEIHFTSEANLDGLTIKLFGGKRYEKVVLDQSGIVRISMEMVGSALSANIQSRFVGNRYIPTQKIELVYDNGIYAGVIQSEQTISQNFKLQFTDDVGFSVEGARVTVTSRYEEKTYTLDSDGRIHDSILCGSADEKLVVTVSGSYNNIYWTQTKYTVTCGEQVRNLKVKSGFGLALSGDGYAYEYYLYYGSGNDTKRESIAKSEQGLLISSELWREYSDSIAIVAVPRSYLDETHLSGYTPYEQLKVWKRLTNVKIFTSDNVQPNVPIFLDTPEYYEIRSAKDMTGEPLNNINMIVVAEGVVIANDYEWIMGTHGVRVPRLSDDQQIILLAGSSRNDVLPQTVEEINELLSIYSNTYMLQYHFDAQSSHEINAVFAHQSRFTFALSDPNGEDHPNAVYAIFEKSSKTCVNRLTTSMKALRIQSWDQYVVFSAWIADLDQRFLQEYSYWEGSGENVAKYELDPTQLHEGTIELTAEYEPLYRLSRDGSELDTNIKSVKEQKDGSYLVRLSQRNAWNYDSIISLPEGAYNILLDNAAVSECDIMLASTSRLVSSNISFQISKEDLEKDALIECYIITPYGKSLQFIREIQFEVFSYRIPSKASSSEVIFDIVWKGNKNDPFERCYEYSVFNLSTTYGSTFGYGIAYDNRGHKVYANLANPGSDYYDPTYTREDYIGAAYSEDRGIYYLNEGKWVTFHSEDDDFAIALNVDQVPVILDDTPPYPIVVEGNSQGMGGEYYLLANGKKISTDNRMSTTGLNLRCSFITGYDEENQCYWVGSDFLADYGLYDPSTGYGMLYIPLAEPEAYPYVYDIDLFYRYENGKGEVVTQKFDESLTLYFDAPVLEKWNYVHYERQKTVTSDMHYVTITNRADWIAYETQVQNSLILDWNGNEIFTFNAWFDRPEEIACVYAVADVPDYCEHQYFELFYDKELGYFTGTGILGDGLNMPRGFNIYYELVAEQLYNDMPTVQVMDLLKNIVNDEEYSNADLGMLEGWTYEEVAPSNGWTLEETYRKWAEVEALFIEFAEAEKAISEQDLIPILGEDLILYYPAYNIYDAEGVLMMVLENYYNLSGERIESDYNFDLALMNRTEHYATLTTGMSINNDNDTIQFVTGSDNLALILPDFGVETMESAGIGAVLGVLKPLASGAGSAIGSGLSTAGSALVNAGSKALGIGKQIAASEKLAKGADLVSNAFLTRDYLKAAGQVDSMLDYPMGHSDADWMNYLTPQQFKEYTRYQAVASGHSFMNGVFGLLPGATIPSIVITVYSDILYGVTDIEGKYRKMAELNMQMMEEQERMIEYMRMHQMGYDLHFKLDPSGYVFEGIVGNRIEGVTATVYYLDSETGNWVKWDSESYDEGPNPNITGNSGEYGWDVLTGKWKVIFEKDGYYTVESIELDVPPSHMDVNMSMVSKFAALIKGVNAGAMGEYIEFVFDKPVLVDDVKNKATLLFCGEPVDGEIVPQNAALTSFGNKQNSGDNDVVSGLNVATVFRFIPDEELDVGSSVLLHADAGILTYNGLECEAFESDYIIIPETVADPITALFYEGISVIEIGEQLNVTDNLSVTGTEGQIIYKSLNPDIAQVSEDGTVTALRSGMAYISISCEDVQTVAAVRVNEQPHVHDFSEEIPLQMYLCSEATCANKATYYFVCSCGQIGSQTYEYGEKATEHSGVLVWNITETHHIKAYDCCGDVIVAEEEHHWENGICSECEYGCVHSGGTATCTEKAICSACGKEYGDFGTHTYGTLINAVAEKHTQTELSPGVAAHYHCACGKYFTEAKVETTLDALTGTTPSHSYGDWKNNDDKHWKECTCGKKSDEGNHVDSDSNNKCDTCDRALPGGGGVTPPPAHTHDYGTTWKTDGENHWYECSCGDKKDSATHSGGTATCKEKAKCSVCNTEYGKLAEHKYSEATCTAKAKCSVCGNETGELAVHTYVDGKCTCGATDPNYQPPHKHTFVEGKCECGETDPNYVPPHKHTFVEGKCECGETDPNYVPPHEHSFVDGKCSCGAADPNYVPPHEHNFVEGKCECGETDSNYVPPHEHNFVEGKCECGETDPNYNPGNDDPEEPNKEFGAGAITGIAVGFVAVVGGGGFALFWFVLKKKTWADLLMVFKK